MQHLPIMGGKQLTNHGKETTGDGCASDKEKNDDFQKSLGVASSHSGEDVVGLGRHDGLRLTTMLDSGVGATCRSRNPR